jgi:hypothetical protein
MNRQDDKVRRIVVGVDGDVTFGAGVVAVGQVRMAGPRHVPDGEVLGR